MISKQTILAALLLVSSTALGADDRAIHLGANGKRVTVKAPASLAADYTFVLPSAAGSAGPVYFGGPSGALLQDPTFFWLDASNYLGIGTASPSANIHIVKTAPDTNAAIYIDRTASTNGPAIDIAVSSTSGGRGLRVLNSGAAGGAASIFAAHSNGANSGIAVGGTTAGSGQAIYGEVNGTGTGTAVAAIKVSPNGNAFGIASGSTGSIVFQNVQQTPAFTTYGITWPNAQGASGTTLRNNGSGTLSWVPFQGLDGAGASFARALDDLAAEGYSAMTSGAGHEFADFYDSQRYAIFADNSGDLRIVNKALGVGIELTPQGHVFAPYFVAAGPGAAYAPTIAVDLTSGDEVGLYSPGGLGSNTLGVATDRTERIRVAADGKVGIGTPSPTELLDVAANTMRLRTPRTPASSTEACDQGEIAWDAAYVYVCVATDSWARTALASW